MLGWLKAGAIVVVLGAAVGSLWYAYNAGQDVATEKARADMAEAQLKQSQESLKVMLDEAAKLTMASRADAARAEQFAGRLAESESKKEELLNENIKLERATCIKPPSTKRLRDYFNATDLRDDEAKASGSAK